MCREVGQISQLEQRPTRTGRHDLRILQGVFLLLFHHKWPQTSTNAKIKQNRQFFQGRSRKQYIYIF